MAKFYTFEQRVAAFWAKVDRSAGPEACWTWKGAVTSKHAYGCFQLGQGQVVGAHKVAWMLTNGCPGSLCVLHRCDNRVCVNPAHLFLGTKVDNAQDMLAKGRDASRGEKNWGATLTDVKALEILEKSTGAWGEATRFAREYGVKPGAIHALLRGDSWAHLPRKRTPTRFRTGRGAWKQPEGA